MSDLPGYAYSPPISIELQLGDEIFRVGSFGGDKIIVHGARRMPAASGVVRVIVDGRVTTYQVEVPEGIEPQRAVQRVRVIEASPVNAVA